MDISSHNSRPTPPGFGKSKPIYTVEACHTNDGVISAGEVYLLPILPPAFLTRTLILLAVALAVAL